MLKVYFNLFLIEYSLKYCTKCNVMYSILNVIKIIAE